MVELFKALATSWPFWGSLAATAVILVALFLFRSQLGSLIGRIKGIGKKRFIDATGGLEQATQGGTEVKRVGDELLAQINTNPYTREVQNWIEAELGSKSLPIDSETARVLLGYTAALGVGFEFQRIYNLIWGTQIMILNHLNSRPFATKDDVLTYYNLGAAQSPETFEHYSFEQYSGFLINQALILQHENTYAITQKGRSFLLFIVNQGLNQYKVG